MSNELPRPFGTYTLLKLLARGGMGEIYLARTAGITGFEKYYAVKKLLKKFTHDNDVGARFIDEAKLGARLQHPNIVQVYDLGRVNDELYMATEFVDGFDLRRVLRFCHEKKKRIPLDIALFIVREILSGLAYAHRQVDAEGHSINLIHRDISPQNVLVSFEGEVKIIDFGLAKSTQRSQETQANVLLGNFGYMSPEQARGHQLDVRTDVYSAGIVLFELVTGTKRFVEENPLRLLEMVARPTPIVPSDRVPGNPKTIDKIYSKATSPAKEERFDSAEAFRDDVTTALHRINPKASRENLAQFLNHLFLGGAAPAPVDADALDKSVAVRVRDLYDRSDAFQAPVEGDVKDRRLHDFSDDAPQTASHPLMRQARAGDTLTHQQLTGDDAVAAAVASAGTAEHVRPTAAPPASQSEAIRSPPAAKSSPPIETTQPNPSARKGEAVAAASAVPATELGELNDIGGVTAPRGQDLSNSAEQIDASELVVDLGPINEGTPTSIYDSPEWPGQLDAAVAGDALEEAIDASLDVDVQRQIEEQAAQMEAQAEVQRQLEIQAREAKEAAVEARAHALAQKQAAEEKPAERAPPPSERPNKQAEKSLLERALAAKEAAAAERAAAERAGGDRQLPRPPPQGQSGVHRAPHLPPPTQGAGSVVTTHVGPPPKRPQQSVDAQPSIVISMDLEPGEPTVVGAPMPMASGRTVGAHDPTRTVEVSPVNVADKARAGGFGDGGAHESLIIDFDGDAEPQAPGAPAAPEPDKNIRPAAQPLGRRVQSTVATKRPAGRGATTPGADESPGNTMPPPNRRRS